MLMVRQSILAGEWWIIYRWCLLGVVGAEIPKGAHCAKLLRLSREAGVGGVAKEQQNCSFALALLNASG